MEDGYLGRRLFFAAKRAGCEEIAVAFGVGVNGAVAWENVGDGRLKPLYE